MEHYFDPAPSPGPIPDCWVPYLSDGLGGNWTDAFREEDEEQYDWEDHGFLRKNVGEGAFMRIPLTQGYFAIVSPWRYKQMTLYPDGKKKKWCATVRRQNDLIIGVYACRNGRGDEPATVLMHRELRDCLLDSPTVVDHINGMGLDNRDPNLTDTSQRQNTHNNKRNRTVHLGLPTGVEIRAGGKFGGIRTVRLSKTETKTTRSQETWDTPEAAAEWYLSQLSGLHDGRKNWAHNPETVSYPLFPPRMEAELLVPRQSQVVMEDVPF